MSDPTLPPSPTPVPSEPAAAPPAQPLTEFHIGEEFGTAKRNLPPVGIVLICIVAVAILVGIVAFHERAKPQGSGSIDFVSAAEVPGQSTTPDQGAVLVAVTFTLHNTTDKPLWIHTLKAQLTAADGHNYEDEAASAVDLDRYLQAFPTLKESSEPPLSPETKLLAGTSQRATLIFSFPITKKAFDQRKALAISIQPYDQPVPIILK